MPAPQEELAQQTLRAMTRKYAGSAKVWLRAYSHEIGRGDAAAARRALDRAIAALPARKHIKVGLFEWMNERCVSSRGG